MILVTGATGHIGRELVPQLLEAGQSIRVLVRDERKVAHLDPCVERAIGDWDKPETLRAALQGVDKIFLLTFETRQDENIVELAKQAGVGWRYHPRPGSLPRQSTPTLPSGPLTSRTKASFGPLVRQAKQVLSGIIPR